MSIAPRFGGAAALLIAATVAWFFLPTKEWIERFDAWIQELGGWGFIVFGLVYVLAVILVAPASALTIAAGLIFGAWAFPLVVVAASSGAILGFLIARYLGRRKIEQIVQERPKLQAIDKAVSQDGWKFVGLLRLSPLVPFNLQNYVFGITNIGLLPYAAATVVGIMPGTILYVYLGALGKATASGNDANAIQWMFFGIGLIATMIVAYIITRKAKAQLEKAGFPRGERTPKRQ